MSDTLGSYSFLPWLRLGVANNITAADGDPAIKVRASIKVDLTLKGQPVEGETELTAAISRDVALYGPGDIVGIEPRAVARIFEPFFTEFDPGGHSSGDFGFQKRGLGLGLSLVRKFVELHGGSVAAASTPGLGTTVAIRLPRRPEGPPLSGGASAG